mgnify:FL=1
MKLKELDEVIANQNKKIDDLVEMLGMVVAEMPKKNAMLPVTEPQVPQVQLPPELDTKLPPPSKWRAKVDELLGTDFDLQVEESSGGNYNIKILLPPHLDRRNGDEKGKGRDCSSGFVRRASDLSDVEKWVLLIKANIQKKFPDFKKV